MTFLTDEQMAVSLTDAFQRLADWLEERRATADKGADKGATLDGDEVSERE